jgi:hypothetical protein
MRRDSCEQCADAAGMVGIQGHKQDYKAVWPCMFIPSMLESF